jgi:hypothetical protein
LFSPKCKDTFNKPKPPPGMRGNQSMMSPGIRGNQNTMSSGTRGNQNTMSPGIRGNQNTMSPGIGGGYAGRNMTQHQAPMSMNRTTGRRYM